MADWNDPRLVLALQRAAGLTGAAKALGIDHSTAFRRLNALEAKLGVRLFERLPGGTYRTTEAGARMAAAAERMEGEMLALDREIAGRDHLLSGRLRITSSETIAFRVLTRYLAAFRAAHPGIVLELTVDNRILSLSRREADIALRPTRPKEDDLWGRKLADVAWSIYGTRACFDAADGPPGSPEDLARHAVIGWDEASAGIMAADWLDRVMPATAFVYRTGSLVNQFLAAKAGIGLALLPCYLADGDPDLVRAVPDPIPALAGELWIVTHADLKGTARVRAFFDLVGDGLAREYGLFAGRG
ncbi:MAG TPA: LysR family transcriptional regulator [Aliidongia sp.]|uniref:LysR family transcriptional regulator n=1 Tax=Aliidongia sp. TaxID=1914230 RepID=UPI002DDD4780|nr:LysR family transcriptional regulator [Aliidongia sp.]HEV2672943.1 LysR family transcriptional regulator [Aliidongia sp.]